MFLAHVRNIYNDSKRIINEFEINFVVFVICNTKAK
jgi:hypothetical protein